MALNLLDSLNSTAATPEKNAFQLKTKEAPDGAIADFAQLLGSLLNPAQPKDPISADGAAAPTDAKEAKVGQKVATLNADSANPDGSAARLTLATQVTTTQTAMVAGMASPQNLTALVLSPNMTAITPSQTASDAGSLVAFAKSQGLDEDVAAWLLAAGKGTTAAKSEATSEPPALDAQALANAAVTISLLASPAQATAKAVIASAPAEATPSPIQLMPMATPAAWLTPRPAATGKTANAAPTLPQTGSNKDTAHASDLDLTLIFGDSKNPAKTPPAPEASFTPAAWVMAGMPGTAAQTSSLLTASSLVKSISTDKQADDGSAQVDGLNNVNAERSPVKLSDPLSSTGNAKGTEPGMSTAERSELHQGQADKMGQAIGQRMLSEMEKGHWHLKMMLRPANLGNIEVEMRLRNGELDANFTASQASTRDLLQDGLPKLKDILTQMGMDVANMNIGGGSSQKNGGDPTPQQARSLAPATQTDHPEDQATTKTQPAPTTGKDGLDVMV